MVMMEGDNKPVYEQRFNAAVKVIQSLPSNGEQIWPHSDSVLCVIAAVHATPHLLSFDRRSFIIKLEIISGFYGQRD